MRSNYRSFGSLYKGLKMSCRNVRWKTSVIQYEMNALKNTAKLVRDLESGKYKISEYQHFTITEPKKREITATKIKDRQVQRSMCNAELYKELTKSFIYDNAACQLQKGNTFAINRLKYHLQKLYKEGNSESAYYLKCDIHHFFESIPHNVLIDEVIKRVHNPEIRNLVIDVINSFDGDKGLGLGSQISQLLALATLDRLDHIIKEELNIKHYVRYMDDFILIHKDKEFLKYCLSVIEEHLKSIGLELNSKTSLQPIRHGIVFLNWRYFITETGKVILLQTKKRNNRRKKKLNKMIKKNVSKNQLNQTINGMLAHLKDGNTYNIQKEINNIL